MASLPTSRLTSTLTVSNRYLFTPIRNADCRPSQKGFATPNYYSSAIPQRVMIPSFYPQCSGWTPATSCGQAALVVDLSGTAPESLIAYLVSVFARSEDLRCNSKTYLGDAQSIVNYYSHHPLECVITTTSRRSWIGSALGTVTGLRCPLLTHSAAPPLAGDEVGYSSLSSSGERHEK